MSNSQWCCSRWPGSFTWVRGDELRFMELQSAVPRVLDLGISEYRQISLLGSVVNAFSGQFTRRDEEDQPCWIFRASVFCPNFLQGKKLPRMSVISSAGLKMKYTQHRLCQPCPMMSVQASCCKTFIRLPKRSIGTWVERIFMNIKIWLAFSFSLLASNA